MIGEALGNYTITAKLGSGAMGVVFRAEHVHIARTAAIKVLVPELAENATAVQRFFNEARATSSIRHPGIVDVLDCAVDATGRAYIVMENLDGETLAARLGRTESIPWAPACEIARQVAEAIAAAHANGIVHRDLKPENVFLVRDPADPAVVASVKVLDFGIAKLLAADASVRLTMRGVALGTPEYMAPEQCGGAEEVDERADIYALGCILFEMLSGEPPFMGESVQELFALHMFRAAPAIGERLPGLPAWLAGLVTTMLAKKRDERPTSMHGVARALGEGMKAARVAGRSGTSRWGGPRAAALVAGVVAFIGVSALVVAVWSARRSSGPPTRARPLEAAASGGSPDIAPETAIAPPRAIVVPTPPAAPIPPAGAEPAPRQPARAGERPARPARSARPSAAKPKHVGNTDGIVDL
jgi:serine/threonine-protein kinase